MAYTTINKSTDYFNTKLYSGTGSAQDITGLDFQPDFNWIKRRNTTGSHRIQDAVRGSTKYLASNATDGEVDAGDVDAFLSNGFSLDSGSTAYNASGSTYASWNWLANGAGSANTDGSINSTATSANTTAGFSIVKYTGNQTSGATVGHGLGAVPKMIIVKNLNDTENWVVYHASLGNTKRLSLNLTEEETTDSAVWNNTTPTSSVFSLGNSDKSNNVNIPYIAYCFAEKTGYSKFGKYTGNGSTDGTFIYTGFKPAFVMWKNTTSAGYYWHTMDNKREPNNPAGLNLFPNLSNAENDYGDTCDFVSNGFKFRTGSSGLNTNGQVYIYMAFAEAPLVGTNNVPCTAR